jgi:hypothetical protein
LASKIWTAHPTGIYAIPTILDDLFERIFWLYFFADLIENGTDPLGASHLCSLHSKGFASFKYPHKKREGAASPPLLSFCGDV